MKDPHQRAPHPFKPASFAASVDGDAGFRRFMISDAASEPEGAGEDAGADDLRLVNASKMDDALPRLLRAESPPLSAAALPGQPRVLRPIVIVERVIGPFLDVGKSSVDAVARSSVSAAHRDPGSCASIVESAFVGGLAVDRVRPLPPRRCIDAERIELPELPPLRGKAMKLPPAVDVGDEASSSFGVGARGARYREDEASLPPFVEVFFEGKNAGNAPAAMWVGSKSVVGAVLAGPPSGGEVGNGASENGSDRGSDDDGPGERASASASADGLASDGELYGSSDCGTGWRIVVGEVP